MSIHSNKACGVLVTLIIALIQITVVNAQTSAFTYQGRLNDSGTSPNATYEMEFKLFDGAGAQVGSTITNNSVTVENGVFTVQLNFGASAFNGADRLLEIGLRTAGSNDAYTILTPRQPITSTPYAIRAGATTTADTALSANTATSADSATNAAKLGGVPADQYVLTTDPRLESSGNDFIKNSNTQQAADFNISGNGNAAGNLSANIVNAATQYNLGASRVMFKRGHNSIIIGPGAGDSLLSSAQNNTFLGQSAGFASTDGSFNTFVGSLAGRSNIKGSNNTFLGAFSGQDNASGSHNTFLGFFSGNNNELGTDNTFVGHETGGVADSYRNSFFGAKSGRFTTDGFENSFFGAQAGYENTTGSLNSFFGFSSGEENTTADVNAFFGSYSGWKNTTGRANSFFGADAGKLNVTASDNAYFGAYAGAKSTGGSNAFFGSRTGSNNTGGFGNAFFGTGAGIENDNGFGNSFFGRSAGDTNITGSNNTVIGASADVVSGGLSFATAIGAGATVGTSNTMVLGRSNGSDAVQVPGTLVVSTLGTIGLTGVCRNALNQLSTCSSSLRYKTNIASFTRGLTLLNKLNPITFNWRSDNSADLGFSAEDIAAVEPLLVVKNGKGEVEGVKYDRITAVLVNAVKEQQQQINLQQQQVELQRQQINALKKLVCSRKPRAAVCR